MLGFLLWNIGTICSSFYYGGIRVAHHELSSGNLFTAFFSIYSAIFAVISVLPHLTMLHEAFAAQARIRAEIERISEIDYQNLAGLITLLSINFGNNRGRSNMVSEKLNVQVRDLTFSFPSKPNQKSLDGISFDVAAGKVAAFVGASGSGKSTLVALLLRQYDVPDPSSLANNVFTNGVPVSSYQLSFLRQQVATVLQDPSLFAGSILDNVAIGLIVTPDEYAANRKNEAGVRQLCTEALIKAQAWEFIVQLPEGLDTMINKMKTGLLSGGRRQRLVVARALVRRSDLLILECVPNEATSALDSETEQRLQAELMREQARTGMAVILIAHCLSTVRNADTIIVIGNRKKIEEGTHESLLSLKGAYCSMIQRFHDYVLDDRNLDEQNLFRSSTEHTSDKLVEYLDYQSDLESLYATPSSADMRQYSDISLIEGPYAKAIRDAEEATQYLQLLKSNPLPKVKKWTRFKSYAIWQWKPLIYGSMAATIIGASWPLSAWLLGSAVDSLSDPHPDQDWAGSLMEHRTGSSDEYDVKVLRPFLSSRLVRF